MTEAAVIAMIVSYSHIFGMNPDVALAVAKHESRLSPEIVSENGEDVGLFQLNKNAYPDYSEKELKNPQLNAMLGILHLKRVKEECSHQKGIDWTLCFNVGVQGAKKFKHPRLSPYVKAITRELSSLKQEEI